MSRTLFYFSFDFSLKIWYNTPLLASRLTKTPRRGRFTPAGTKNRLTAPAKLILYVFYLRFMMNIHLNCKKGQSIKGKITKSYITFSENKPNSPIVQLSLTLFIAMMYAIFTSLTKVKNKPNSNPIKPNLSQFQCKTNPIKANSKPKQTQFTKCPNRRNIFYNNELYNFCQSLLEETLLYALIAIMAETQLYFNIFPVDPASCLIEKP
jgi:hypothetical protein